MELQAEIQPQQHPLAPDHRKITGFSGNEIFCLNKLGYIPGQLCLGNNVVALGVARGLGAGLSTLAGGEIIEITKLVYQGRRNAYLRMLEEAKRYGGLGLAGATFEVINHGGNLEFVALGSTIHNPGGQDTLGFTTAADAQELFCQVDAGFAPKSFVFGNVAYSIGVGGSIKGMLRGLARGEVPQYTEIFDRTRHLALSRIKKEAKKAGANAVIGIKTEIAPLLGAQEMMMTGTASHHPALAAYNDNPVTSDMTNEEMWNMVNIGFMPLQLVMGVSVYSLGLASGIMSFFRTLMGGEVNTLTELLYEAREKAFARLQKAAQECGADEVVGVKTRVYDLGGGLVEFMVIGTAVKKIAGVSTKSENIPPQAIIQDRETFIDSMSDTVNLRSGSAASAPKMQRGPLTIIFTILIILFYVFDAINGGGHRHR
jgi:uncharacterized protein YbjQ (UPF0145 family)